MRDPARTTEDDLRGLVETAFQFFYHDYLSMLEATLKAPNEAALREIIDVYFKSTFSLTLAARQIWIYRKKVHLKQLQGTTLRVVIGNSKTRVHQGTACLWSVWRTSGFLQDVQHLLGDRGEPKSNR